MKPKFYPRDIIGMIALFFCLVLIAKGINHVVSGIAIMVITFYFADRVNYETKPRQDLYERVAVLEKTKTITAKFKDIPKPLPVQSSQNLNPLTTGDFKPKLS